MMLTNRVKSFCWRLSDSVLFVVITVECGTDDCNGVSKWFGFVAGVDLFLGLPGEGLPLSHVISSQPVGGGRVRTRPG